MRIREGKNKKRRAIEKKKKKKKKKKDRKKCVAQAAEAVTKWTHGNNHNI